MNSSNCSMDWRSGGVSIGYTVHLILSSTLPLEGASAGLFSDATYSIHGTKAALFANFQKDATSLRASGSIAVPLIKEDAAARLSMNSRQKPSFRRSESCAMAKTAA